MPDDREAKIYRTAGNAVRDSVLHEKSTGKGLPIFENRKKAMVSLTNFVQRVFSNSFTPKAVEGVRPGLLSLRNGIKVVLASEATPEILVAVHDAGKVVFFGDISGDFDFFGVHRDSSLYSLEGADACPACTLSEHHTESEGRVVYGEHPLNAGVAVQLRERPFTRFDFTEEWNNLGFGRIRTDGSIWGVHGGFVTDKAVELAGLWRRSPEGSSHVGSYLTLLDRPGQSVLWCARPAGPSDSSEWTVIERFLSDWRPNELPCLPSLCGTPAGCTALATMRLDCDEDISSARDVFEWYHAEGLPFSMAVKTGLPMTEAHLSLLHDVNAAGGTLLSHSHTHPFNWGGSFELAKAEGERSRQWFRDNLPGAPVPDLAVSPFHTNPPCAMQGAEAAGFSGVVSGIIHNDPEYLLGRAGIAPFTEHLVTISQQSMMHGDCYAQQRESVAVHVEALDIQRAARGIFGYLDHPFSVRYQYGWLDKPQRLGAHKKLVEAIRLRPDVWFWTQRQCFDFVQILMRIELETGSDGKVSTHGVDSTSSFRPEYRYRGNIVTL